MKNLLTIMNYLSPTWLITLYGSVLYAYFKLGYLPEFSRPDPKEIIPAFHIVFEFFNFGFLFFIVCIIINFIYYLTMVIISTKQLSKKVKIGKSAYFFFVNILLSVIVYFFDPGGFIDWFLD